MTDTTTLEASSASGQGPRRSGSLTAMRLAELQGLASSMGISGTAKMRKGDLVAAIKSRQNGDSGPVATATEAPARRPRRASSSGQAAPTAEATETEAPKAEETDRSRTSGDADRGRREPRERAERTDHAEQDR